MPITAPCRFRSGSPGSGSTVEAAVEVMPGMPLADPVPIAVPMPVTDPASQCSAMVPSVSAAMLNVMSALPSVSVASSANGATGTSSGTLIRATSDVGSMERTEAWSRRPSVPIMERLCSPERPSAAVATSPPSATATPTSETIP